MSKYIDFDPASEAAFVAAVKAAKKGPGTHLHTFAPSFTRSAAHYCIVPRCGFVIPNTQLPYALEHGATLAKE